MEMKRGQSLKDPEQRELRRYLLSKREQQKLKRKMERTGKPDLIDRLVKRGLVEHDQWGQLKLTGQGAKRIDKLTSNRKRVTTGKLWRPSI
jgi:Mn-dependent DtxR family transcriptional regulator